MPEKRHPRSLAPHPTMAGSVRPVGRASEEVSHDYVRVLTTLQPADVHDGGTMPPRRKTPAVLMISRGDMRDRIAAMLWTPDENPRLITAETFRGEAELRDWLRSVRMVWRLTVRWTPALLDDVGLTEVIAQEVEAPPN